MKLKNILIIVKDKERSRQFYHDLFGLNLILDNDGNVILSEGNKTAIAFKRDGV